ncbi:uncharacterized protein EI90DRAFT_2847515, partial [Cantharellus anzutake]|uniref:uncharacterized protein n=1 Tax=Cantharellus anzutake TaxID=1750568 RepID=UPI0019077148
SHLAFEDGDVILRSTDGVEFRVHKYILSISSPFFSSMFTLPQTSGETQTIEIAEDAKTLDALLRFIYPTSGLRRIENLEEGISILFASRKY